MPTQAQQNALEHYTKDHSVGPWRCTVCNVAVRPGQNDPCDCTRADEAEADQQAFDTMVDSVKERNRG